jgi:periplasmic copper chaperone A
MTFSRMMVKGSLGCLFAAGLMTVGASNSEAHVSIPSGPANVGSSNVVTFGVGHGCEGADTISIEVSLPAEITSARTVPSPEFGQGEVVLDETGAPIALLWTKDTILPGDTAYYMLQARLGSSAVAFTTLYLPVTQTCEAADGTQYVTEWSALPGAPLLEDGSEPPPAPGLSFLPKRYPGWNKWTATAEITSMALFAEAEIVWAGTAAYSANPTTAELIAAEPGVTVLASIPAGTEFWAKY